MDATECSLCVSVTRERNRYSQRVFLSLLEEATLPRREREQILRVHG